MKPQFNNQRSAVSARARVPRCRGPRQLWHQPEEPASLQTGGGAETPDVRLRQQPVRGERNFDNCCDAGARVMVRTDCASSHRLRSANDAFLPPAVEWRQAR